jgi:hypothetical protein
MRLFNFNSPFGITYVVPEIAIINEKTLSLGLFVTLVGEGANATRAILYTVSEASSG